MSKQTLTEDIYEKLVNTEDARACKAIPEEACREVPGNFLRTLISSFLSKLGDALVNPKITLPWLMQSLGAPLWMLGWLVPIRESGSMLPQLAIASAVRRLAIRKWVWVLGSVLQAVAIAFIAVVAYTLDGSSAGWAILGLLVVFSLARGLSSVSSKDVLGKTIPKQRRGSLNGWAESGAGLITLVVAALLMSGLSTEGSRDLYAAGFGLAALCWLLAGGIFSGIKEFPGETDGGRNGLKEALGRVGLLRTDAAFRHFLLTRALMLCSALAAPFMVVLAQQEMEAALSLLALFMAASGLASLVSGRFWGRFADTSSRRVMVSSGLMTAGTGLLVCLITWFARDWLSVIWVLPVLYFLLSIAHQGVRLGRKTYVVNMAEGNRRTDYVSVGNTLIGVILLLMGFISALEPWIGISGVILVLSLMGLAGSLMASRLPEVEQD
ncbi:MFS transporter [uncultured Thalassolituus sp.]|uniref:MFS transporter n=1 Tax=uncultured Thalassolituus sp. TaxID=285273 RepID=UPI0026172935|nr:MFS transporter [uncultured Thalassolituus sp.]